MTSRPPQSEAVTLRPPQSEVVMFDALIPSSSTPHHSYMDCYRSLTYGDRRIMTETLCAEFIKLFILTQDILIQDIYLTQDLKSDMYKYTIYITIQVQ